MLKRVTLVLVSLLLLNSCAELLQVVTGVEGDGTYSPVNRNINARDINETGFMLSWDQTKYSDGTSGSFYYQLYLIEGEQYNPQNFTYQNNIVAEGWNLTSYNVTGLEPNTTYSFVVGVSDDASFAQEYYNIGTVTTLLSSIGNTDGYSPINRNINVYNTTSDGFTLSWESTTYNNGTNGSFYYEVYIIEGTLSNTNYLGYTDMYASGWDFNSYTVEYLNSNTTYSFVIGVSDDGTEALEYYNIGSVTTQSYSNNNGYSPSNTYINIFDVNTNGFTLSWDSTTYNNGSYGTFYYKLYVVEGTEYNVNNFTNYDIVAEDWHLTSYMVTGLNPDTTYSFVVGVSETANYSEVYYSIGTTTTDFNTFSPINHDISVYDTTTDGFTLYWEPTTYYYGGGSFYYELYLVEGQIYNVENLSDADLIASGFDFNSYVVTGLNSDTTYSYVVHVRDIDYYNVGFYNIGTATTQYNYTPSTDFMGSWEFTDGSAILVYNFYSDSFSIDMYDEYAEFMMTYNGSLSVLSDTSFEIIYESVTDAYGNVTYESGSNTLYWSMSGDTLILNGDMYLTPYDGSIEPLIDPNAIYLYPSNAWVEGNVDYSETVKYIFYVNAGSTYTISWDDSYQGSNTYTGDVSVSAYDESGNSFFTNADSGFNYPQSISVPYGEYTIVVEVNGYYSGGSFGLRVSEY